jgi:hypothetical protein
MACTARRRCRCGKPQEGRACCTTFNEHQVAGDIYMAPFGIKVSLKYSTNTSVSQNTEVSNTLSCLDLVNTLVLETESILQNFIFLPY